MSVALMCYAENESPHTLKNNKLKTKNRAGQEPLTGCKPSYSKKKIKYHLLVHLHLHHKELGQKKTCQFQPMAKKLKLAGKPSEDP